MDGANGMKQKKKLVAIILVIAVICSMMSIGAAARFGSGDIELSFSGSKAYCDFLYTAENANTTISITLILWNGTTLVGSWSNSGTGYVSVSGTAAVTSGVTYRLAAYVVVNGDIIPTIDQWGTCP